MKLKSYFSASVEAAMELARTELGEEALLIHARPATPETRYLGSYEVVFGTPAGAAAQTEAPAAPPPDRLARDVAEMKREIERLARCFQGVQALASTNVGPSEQALYRQLIENELDAALAVSVSQGASLSDLFEVDPSLGGVDAATAVVALVGPPSAGKTTTLIKLAARYGLALQKSVQILTADIHRIAAADQLRTLAGILGVGCEVVETPMALARALAEHRSKELILIDTPGLAPKEMEDSADLARVIASHPGMDTHLVVSAAMKPADMGRAIERFGIFGPGKLIYTHLDETDRYGALISEAARRSLPVSFLAAGQQIPDDLEPASKARLTELVFGPEAVTISKSLGATA